MKRSEVVSQSFSLDNPLRVIPISSGIAIGPARLFRTGQPDVVETKINPEQVVAEKDRLQTAIAASLLELQELQALVAKTVGRHEADIFEAQQLILQDPDLLDEANESISLQLFS